MRPKKHEATREGVLFRARLDQIINMKHELVQLAGKIDWTWIDGKIAPLYSDNGLPGIETRFMIGLLLLKHIFGLSDEGVCERWATIPTSSTSLARSSSSTSSRTSAPTSATGGSGWATSSSCCCPRPTGGARQRRATHPGPGAGHRRHHGAAQERHLSDRRQAVARGDQGARPLGASPWRAATAVLSAPGQAGLDDGGALRPRQTPNRHHRELRFLCTRLGRLIRDIRREIKGQGPSRRPSRDRSRGPSRSAPSASASAAGSSIPSRPGGRVHRQRQGPLRYEFGVKVSIVTTNGCASAGQFGCSPGAAGQPLRRPHIAVTPLRAPGVSPDARSSASTPTRDIAATMRPIHGASSSQARSAACSASSNASFSDDPPSNLSSVIRRGGRGPRPLLPQGPGRRCRKRCPHRRRLQLQAHPRLAEDSFAPHPLPPDGNPFRPHHPQSGFLTGD